MRKWPERRRGEVRHTPTSRLACYSVTYMYHSIYMYVLTLLFKGQSLSITIYMNRMFTEIPCNWLFILSVGTIIGEQDSEREMGRHIREKSIYVIIIITCICIYFFSAVRPPVEPHPPPVPLLPLPLPPPMEPHPLPRPPPPVPMATPLMAIGVDTHTSIR